MPHETGHDVYMILCKHCRHRIVLGGKFEQREIILIRLQRKNSLHVDIAVFFRKIIQLRAE